MESRNNQLRIMIDKTIPLFISRFSFGSASEARPDGYNARNGNYYHNLTFGCYLTSTVIK